MCHILLLTVSLLIATPIHCQYFITADSHCLAIGTNSLTNITQVFWSPISYSTSSNCVNWAFEKHFNQETQSIYNGKLYVNGIGANAMNKATYLNQRMYAMMDSTPINIKADPITHVPLIESLQNDSFSASSYYNYKVSPYDARRTSGSAWVSSTIDNPADYLQVDLGEQHPIESVSVFPRATGALQYVTTYTLSYSIDGQIFEDYPTTLNGPIGITGDDAVDEANSVLDSPIVIARYLRFTPLTYVGTKAMRVEAYRLSDYDAASSMDWTDYTLEVTLSIQSGTSINLLFRTQSATDYGDRDGYFLSVAPTLNATDFGVFSENSTHYITKSTAWQWEFNVIYTVRVEITGTQFIFYRNDEFLFTDSDSTFQSGTIGLRTSNTIATFQSVRIAFQSANTQSCGFLKLNSTFLPQNAEQACLDEHGTFLASVHSERDWELAHSVCGGERCWIGGISTAKWVWEWSDGTEWNYDPPWDPNGYSEGSGYPTEPYTCIIDNRTGLHDCHGQYFYPICNGICDE
eukprot:843436_1